jgi:hypothetical protein
MIVFGNLTFNTDIGQAVRNQDEAVNKESSVFFCLLHASVLQSLLFELVDGGNMFLQNLG